MSVHEIRIKYGMVMIQLANVLLLTFLYLFLVYYGNDFNLTKNWEVVVSYVSIALIIYQLYVMIKLNITLFDFRFVFLLMTYLFMFGQIWLLGFGFEDLLLYPMKSYSDNLLFESGFFTLCYTQALFIGFVGTGNRRIRTTAFFFRIQEEKLNKLVYRTGIILLVLAMPFKIYRDFYSLFYIRAIGYYANAPAFGPAKDIEVLFIPSILCILFSNTKSRRANTFLIVITVIYSIVIMVLTGDRRYYVTGLIALLMGYFKLYKKNISARALVLFGVFIVFMMNLLSLIRSTRHLHLHTIGEFFTANIPGLISTTFLTETLAEFGVTFFTVVIAMKIIPTYYPYQYGLSFFGSIPSILPIGWAVGDFFRRVSVFRVLNSIEGRTLGSSLPGELYANFGWFGILGAIIVGIVLSKVVSNTPDRTKQNSFLEARNFSLLYILINYVRASTIEMLRQTLIVFLVPTTILYLLYVQEKRNMFKSINISG